MTRRSRRSGRGRITLARKKKKRANKNSDNLEEVSVDRTAGDGEEMSVDSTEGDGEEMSVDSTEGDGVKLKFPPRRAPLLRQLGGAGARDASELDKYLKTDDCNIFLKLCIALGKIVTTSYTIKNAETCITAIAEERGAYITRARTDLVKRPRPPQTSARNIFRSLACNLIGNDEQSPANITANETETYSIHSDASTFINYVIDSELLSNYNQMITPISRSDSAEDTYSKKKFKRYLEKVQAAVDKDPKARDAELHRLKFNNGKFLAAFSQYMTRLLASTSNIEHSADDKQKLRNTIAIVSTRATFLGLTTDANGIVTGYSKRDEVKITDEDEDEDEEWYLYKVASPHFTQLLQSSCFNSTHSEPLRKIIQYLDTVKITAKNTVKETMGPALGFIGGKKNLIS